MYLNGNILISQGMEGWGVKQIMTDLQCHNFKVTRVVHDKDSSAMRQVMDVYHEAVEGLCLSEYITILL
jgi:hypothetical protein